MNETKSKALLIVSTITILAISSTIVAGHVLFPPTHGQLEIIDVEPISDIKNKVTLRWWGNDAEIECTILGTYGQVAGHRIEWTEHASYGHVFTVTLLEFYYDAWFCFDDKEVHLYAMEDWATLRLRGGELYFMYGDPQPKW